MQSPPAVPVSENGVEHRSRRASWVVAVIGLVAIGGLAGAVWKYDLYRSLPPFAANNSESLAKGDTPVGSVDNNPNAVELSERVVERLRITTEEVKPAKAHRPLEFAGSLAPDPDKLGRVRSTFPGKVEEITNYVEEFATGSERRSEDRALTRSVRVGDFVNKGDRLAVLWSADFGQKKSDLIDALSQLATDENSLKRYEANSTVLPPLTIELMRRSAEQSRIAARRAENTLRAAGMTDEEIETLKKKALDETGKPLDAMNRQKDKDWARIEIRAPFSGTIVERNVNPGDYIQPDNQTDLFKIADLRRLLVQVNVREEDLPKLEKMKKELKRPIPWTVQLASDTGAEKLVLPSEIERFSPTIDPIQHTAFAIGHVDNPEGRMRGAQFITATISFPPPENTVSIPTSALVEDGNDSIVFVQPDPNKTQYVMKRVAVAKRFADVVHIRNNLTADEVQHGVQTLPTSERVVVENVIGLKSALEDVQSNTPSK